MKDLQSLIFKFNEHAEKARENQKEWIKSFAENNPGQDLPEYLKDDFNLPESLAFLCSELLDLKKKIQGIGQ